MKFILKIADVLFSALLYIAGFLLTVMVLLVFANVVLRYVFNSGIYWSEEASLVIVVWFTFIACALGVKEDLHISIDVLPKKITSSGAGAVFLMFFKCLVEVACGIVLLIYGIKLTHAGSLSVLPATGLSNAVSYVIAPLSAVFVILFAILRLSCIRKKKPIVSRKNNFGLQGDSDA